MKIAPLHAARMFLSSFRLQNFSRKYFLDQFLVSLFIGIYVLFIIIVAHIPSGISGGTETEIFVESWICAPVFAILGLLVLHRIQNKYLSSCSQIFPLLSSINTIAFSISISALNAAGHGNDHPTLTNVLILLIVGILPLINILAIWGLIASSEDQKSRITEFTTSFQNGGSILFGTLALLNFIGLYPFYFGKYSTPVSEMVFAITIGGLAIFINNPFHVIAPLKGFVFPPLFNKWRPKEFFLRSRSMVNTRPPFLLKRYVFIYDLLILLFVILTGFNPEFSTAVDHQNFYLGPVNHLLHGGTMLVDTFSQYGNLSIIFLAKIFQSNVLPFTYQSLTLIVSILTILQFIIVYLMLTSGLGINRFYSTVILGAALLLGMFGTLGIFQSYPSVGPFRFGVVYLLLATILLEKKIGRFRSVFIVVEYLLVGVSSLWSFETFVYTAFSFFGILFFESFAGTTKFWSSLKYFSIRIAGMLAAIILCQLVFAFFTYQQAGALPDWKVYFEFISTYSGDDNIAGILITPWTPWIIPIIIYFGSLMAFLFRLVFLGGVKKTLEEEIIIGLTFFGLAQYTYFLGRAHPNNLFHISVPVVMIAGYWAIRIIHHSSAPKYIRLASRFFFYSAITLVFISLIPTFITKTYANQTGFRIALKTGHNLIQLKDPLPLLNTVEENLYAKEKDPQVADALLLMQKYTPGKSPVTLFLTNATTTEALFNANRGHTFQINDPIEDLLSSTLRNRVLAYQPPLKVGDPIFVIDPGTYKEGLYNSLIVDLLKKVCSDFSLQEVERSQSGVMVMKLTPVTMGGSPFCSQVNALVVK